MNGCARSASNRSPISALSAHAPAPKRDLSRAELIAQVAGAWDAHVDALTEAQRALDADPSELEGFTRILFLQLLNSTWISYLEQIDTIRDNAMLQVYAQRNPQLEFVRMASDAFDEAMDVLKGNVIERWFAATDDVIRRARRTHAHA